MSRMRSSPPKPAGSRPAPDAGALQTPTPGGPARPAAPRTLAAVLARAAHPASLLLLAAATFVVFAGVLRADWILFDDPDYVLDNPHINRGFSWAGLRWILRSVHAANYHPLTSLLHMLNVQVFGLAPAGHHAVSLVLHVLNAVLLAVALHRLTGAWWKSVAVAAVFALHPLRVESVAWASELKDVLSGLFFMLALLAYARWAERPAPWRYAVVVACLGLGLLAKPMLVTLPCVLVLLDVWPLGRLRGGPPAAAARRAPCAATQGTLAGLIAEKWPMFLLALASSAITFIVQHASGAMKLTMNTPLLGRMLNASLSYWRYLGSTAWPHRLLPFYQLPPGTDFGRGALAALALLGVTALVLWQARMRPQLLVGWLWYAGMTTTILRLRYLGSSGGRER